ncbi:D-lactate dehydrogenase [Pseudomonas sp. CNPSo 3701]|uniref:D-lactate dehydrogenase n=1 Tax=Pseudomonas sp. CNPSo 3701 TaxID=3027943 RepID=UPI002364A1A4|nr:D-lactate dehydrogenase [Pseudomonas sp. CNPSo 3701]MDD1509041.1 D-lactate dehydrogenase [Pseudomonas sp. CNPSo 3701]
MDLVSELQEIVGRRHVLQGDAATRRFRLGIRYGGGAVLAVVQPGSLVEMWRVLQGCHRAGTIIICQAANTGLTGGSTPVAEGYDRPVVLINTLRLTRLALLRQGKQVISQPGVTLSQLETNLKPLGREPHSVIGSTCIGASIAGGVCNNSGGSLIRRGPAFTQLSLFARIDEAGQLQLVNHLGMDLGDTPEEILTRLDEGRFDDSVVQDPPGAMASDREYASHVRDVDSATPARYNADPRRLYEASGSAGKIAVFALRLDTFPADRNTQVFYIGSNRAADLETIRRHILTNFTALPIAGEYMHRTAYELSRTYGKDLFLFIQGCGAQRVPQAFAWKTRFDAFTERLGLGSQLGDRILQRCSAALPEHLPARLNAFATRFEHHLLLKMGEDGIDEARTYLQSWLPTTDADFIECDTAEGNAAFLNRFAVGNAMNRYRAVHRDTVEDILALDIALPRNTQDWFETLPSELAEQIEVSMYCGHFFCHVLHQEYLVKKGHDCAAIKQNMLALLDARGARYPAEHNVGHLYDADPELERHYRQLDPTNAFNPGIGRLTRRYRWRDDCCAEHSGNPVTAAARAPLTERTT